MLLLKLQPKKLTRAMLRQTFDYRDGQLFWRSSPTGFVKTGQTAGSLKKRGYTQVKFNHKVYQLHRLIWLWHKGHLPPALDHIDRQPTNNRLENLRPATLQQNGGNSKRRKDNESGYRGVSWFKAKSKWRVYIGTRYLGMFKDKELAAKTYDEAAKETFGEFANLNFPAA